MRHLHCIKCAFSLPQSHQRAVDFPLQTNSMDASAGQARSEDFWLEDEKHTEVRVGSQEFITRVHTWQEVVDWVKANVA